MSAREIDRTSPVPFYHQLKTLLRAEITRSKLVAGDRLPGDHQLCAKYDVSRTVVRQALTELEFEGVIDRFKGKGTFVAAEKTSEGLVQSLTGLYEDVAMRGLHLRSEVRRLDVGPAEESIAKLLELAVGTEVVHLERLRFLDDVPWVMTSSHFAADLLPDLANEDLANGSLYAIMERHGVRPVRGRRTVEARVANAALARDLEMHRGGAVLLLTSISYDADGRPVETFQAFHRGDRSRFEVELTRSDRETGTPLMVVV